MTLNIRDIAPSAASGGALADRSQVSGSFDHFKEQDRATRIGEPTQRRLFLLAWASSRSRSRARQLLSLLRRCISTARRGSRLGEPEFEPSKRALKAFLKSNFPPNLPLPPPEICRANRRWIARKARGLPGDTMVPGLFPDARTKNARLVLSLAGEVGTSRALERARNAYDPNRSHFARPSSYHAHDAVACALVEPNIPRDVKTALIRNFCADTRHTRGWRSRRKTWQLWRWAAERGLVDGPP